MTAAPYYRTRPSPTHPGRWLVVHTVPGTHVESIDDDCPTLASAEKAAAWREAERAPHYRTTNSTTPRHAAP